jgi:hypothetical protein
MWIISKVRRDETPKKRRKEAKKRRWVGGDWRMQKKPVMV